MLNVAKKYLFKSRPFVESANNAIIGILLSFKNERNLRIHFIAAIFVLAGGLWLGVSRLELVLLLLAITFVFMAEMLNTTIEVLTNAFVDGENPSAQFAKDVAAGSVLIAVIGAVAVGYLVFFDRLKSLEPPFIHEVKSMPVHVVVVCLILVMMVTLILKTLSPHGTPLRGGMPSGHAALAFFAATVILWFSKNFLIISAAYLLAVLVAQSRVQRRIHGFWEVASGAFVGFFLTLLILRIFLH